jgi:hypothetical protein
MNIARGRTSKCRFKTKILLRKISKLQMSPSVMTQISLKKQIGTRKMTSLTLIPIEAQFSFKNSMPVKAQRTVFQELMV